jgi:hypothetical protein
MTWEIRLVKWKQKRARKAKEKKDLKDVMRQLHQKIDSLPEKNSHLIHCNFPETAEKLKAKGFDVEFSTGVAYYYWYNVSWKE